MHELSVVQEIIRIVHDHTCMHRDSRVERIDLVVGELTGYRQEMLQEYFDILAQDTDLEGARIQVRYVRPVLTCRACGLEFEREGLSFSCPACGATAVLTGAGKELYINAVELGEKTS